MISINTFYSHLDIFRLLGSTVDPILPTTWRCPVCTHGLYIRHAIAGGAWYNCFKCGFAVDSIGLYQYGKSIRKLEDAIEDLTQQLPAIKLKPVDIQQYIKQIDARQQACRTFWKAARDRATRFDLTTQALLQQHNLYTGYPLRVRALFGIATKQMVATLPDEPAVRGTVIVVPLQDMPGHFTGFQFIGNKTQRTYLVDDWKLNNQSYTGFAFLDAMDDPEGTIIALDDVILALQLHVHHQAATGCSDFPVIGMVNLKPDLWSTIRAKQLILWTNQPINMLLPAAHASQAEHTSISDTVLSTTSGDLGMLQQIQATAIPCETVLKDQVTTPEAAEILKQLPTDKQQQLVDACESKEEIKQVTEQLSDTLEHTVDLNDSRVIDREDGWYVISRRRKLQQISNVKIVIQHVVHPVNGGDVMCYGRLLYKDKIIGFSTLLEDITSGRTRWLEKQVVAVTGEMPIIATRWRAHLYALSSKLYPPEIYHVYNGVTWDAEASKWRTPHLDISATEICRKTYPIPVDHLEAVKLLDVPAPQLKAALESLPDSAASAGACWLIAAIVHNILSGVKGWKPVNIGFVCNTLAEHYLTDWVRDGLGLAYMSIPKFARLNVLMDPAIKSTLPCVLMPTSPVPVKIPIILSGGLSANIIMAVPANVEECREKYPAWVFIANADGLKLSADLWGAVPAMLQWLAKNNNVLPESATTFKQVLAAFHHWVNVLVAPVCAVADSTTSPAPVLIESPASQPVQDSAGEHASNTEQHS